MPKHVINNVTNDVQVPVFKSEATLTDAQIKALPTTPIELIAAPGAGKFINVISAFAVLDSSSGSYTGITGATWTIGATIDLSCPMIAENALGFADSVLCQFQFPALFVGDGNYIGNLITTAIVVSNIENEAITIRDNWEAVAGDYTGGNAANTLKVTVFYSIFDV